MSADKYHIMLDLETMSLADNAAIVSIGAVKFQVPEDLEYQSCDDLRVFTGETFYSNVDLHSCLMAGLRIDASTIKFWMQQEDAARKKLFENVLPLNEALDQFDSFVGLPEHVLGMWGNGAGFDNVLLKNAYHALSRKIPWDYKKNRCYRTLRSMFELHEPQRIGTYHHALDDAITQAVHLIKILKSLGYKD